jgi:hypothetical protein
MEKAKKFNDYIGETFRALVHVVNELPYAKDKDDGSSRN